MLYAEISEYFLAVTLGTIRKHEDRNLFQTVLHLLRIPFSVVRKDRLHSSQPAVTLDNDKPPTCFSYDEGFVWQETVFHNRAYEVESIVGRPL